MTMITMKISNGVKKILFICLLAVLLFSLTISVQAAVNVTVTFPSDGQLNYGATKAITWTSSAPAGSKFNISIFQTAVTPIVTESIVTQVLCKDTAACTYNWKVYGSYGVDYKIRVCVAGAVPPDCGDSPTAFKIIPPALTTQQQVFDLFRTALGSRYNDLNAYDKVSGSYYSGVAGVHDFITTDWDTNLTDKVHRYLIEVGATINPSLGTVNEQKVYMKDILGQLTWFKGEFLAKADSNINTRDKKGISYAMTNRFKDLCANDFNADVNALRKIYNNEIAATEKAKQAAIKECNNTYNASIVSINKNTESNPLKKAVQQFIAKEGARLVKEECVNQAYTKYYNQGFPASGTTPASISVLAARAELAANYPTKEAKYTDCITKATWVW